MRQAVAVLLVLLVALPLFSDARAEKRRLIGELLGVLDASYLIDASLDSTLVALRTVDDAGNTVSLEELPEDYQAAIEEERRLEEERIERFRARILTHVDRVRFVDEICAPLFDDRFTASELEELTAFLKTKAGQKLVSAIPELVGSVKGRSMLIAATRQAGEEMQKEAIAAIPVQVTMSDIGSIASAVEAYATDNEKYPEVAFEELEGVIEPTYIAEMAKEDAWGTPYFYISNGTSYRIVSAGADRRFDWSSRNITANAQVTPVESDSADIIYQDGTFIQYPVEKEAH